MAQTPETAVADRTTPPDVTWWRTDDGAAHAFPDAAGFMRSLCRRERWTVLLRAATEPTLKQCSDCSLLVDGAPGEITEAWGR